MLIVAAEKALGRSPEFVVSPPGERPYTSLAFDGEKLVFRDAMQQHQHQKQQQQQEEEEGEEGGGGEAVAVAAAARAVVGIEGLAVVAGSAAAEGAVVLDSEAEAAVGDA
jgi:hypothetical protein